MPDVKEAIETMARDPKDKPVEASAAFADPGHRPVGEPSATEALVRAAQNGSSTAYEQLYRAHAGRVYALCLRLSADVAAAEQLTQDAFVRAWERLDSFRAASRFSTWLHRLTVNLVLDWQRQNRRRGRHEVAADRAGGLDATAAMRPAPPPRIGDRLDLERAIARLPEGARTVFVLHEVEGFPLKDIATRQGIAEGTVKAQLFRARRLLREALK